MVQRLQPQGSRELPISSSRWVTNGWRRLRRFHHGSFASQCSMSQNGALCGIPAALDCRCRALVRGRADQHSHHEAAEIERAIETFARAPNGGLVVLPDANTLVHRESIIARAAQHRRVSIIAMERGLSTVGVGSAFLPGA